MSDAKMPELRMDAYYYGFDPTGVRHIDLILSAVACAGKSYHSTEDWHDSSRPWPGHTGETPVEWIQNAANAAADLCASGQQVRALEWTESTETALDCDWVDSFGLYQISEAVLFIGHTPSGVEFDTVEAAKAADALTAQAEEIRALRERNAEMEAALRELLGILEIASVMPDAIQKVYVPKMDAPELSRARAALAGKGEA